MNAKKILLTGASGFTGKYLYKELIASGFEVSALTNNLQVDGKRVDIVDRESVFCIFEKIKPDCVIHLAGVSSVTAADYQAIYRTNVEGTRVLAEACRQYCVGKFIFSSTSNVYGSTKEEVLNESARIDLRNDYAVSKYAAELVLALFKNDFEITIVRPFNYTGRGQAQTFLIPKIVEAFRNKEPELELGNLNVSRDFSDVRDVASVYARLVDLPSNFDIINICSGRAYSIGQIVKICSSLTHHDVHIKTNPHFVRKNDILKQCGDADLLNAKMGVNFKRRMLSETLHWMIFP